MSPEPREPDQIDMMGEEELREELREAISRSSAPSWNHIETAPKNAYILLCLDGRDWAIGCWNRNIYVDGERLPGAWVNDDGTEATQFFLKPTHWMRLPELP